MPTSLEISSETIDARSQGRGLFESIAPWWPFVILQLTFLLLAVGFNLDPSALWPVPSLIGP